MKTGILYMMLLLFSLTFSWYITGDSVMHPEQILKLANNLFVLPFNNASYEGNLNSSVNIIQFDNNGNYHKNIIHLNYEALINGYAVDENNTIFMLATSLNYSRRGKTSYNFMKIRLSPFGYEEISLDDANLDFTINTEFEYNKYAKLYYFATHHNMADGILTRISEYNNSGYLLWNFEYEFHYSWFFDFSLTLSANLSDAFLLLKGNRHSMIVAIQKYGFIKFDKFIIDIIFRKLLPTQDNGLIILGSEELVYSHDRLFKFDQNINEEWKIYANRSNNFNYFSNAMQTQDGNYVIELKTCNGDSILLGLFPNGTIRYRKKLYYNCEMGSVVELSNNKFAISCLNYPIKDGFIYVQSLEIPDNFAKLKCFDLGECGKCAIGYYWNYTKCVLCKTGCLECVDFSDCQRCSRNYYLSPNNTCILIPESFCNCSTQNPDISQDCLSKCSSQNCNFKIEDIFIDHYNLFINKSICKCPENLFNNKTHCIKYADSVECPPLCARCIYNNNVDKLSLLPSITTSCIKCRLNNTIISEKISENSEIVNCKCKSGFLLNSTGCVLPVVYISSNQNKTADLFTLFLGILGAVIAGVVLQVKTILIYRFWKRIETKLVLKAKKLRSKSI